MSKNIPYSATQELASESSNGYDCTPKKHGVVHLFMFLFLQNPMEGG